MTSTICPLPWMHLATHPEGKATLCCISDHTNNMSAARTNGSVLNLNRNKVIEIMNSDTYVDVRKQMRNGLKPNPCIRCYKEEENGIYSKRQQEILRFGTDYNDNNGIIDVNLEFIELRLGNLCNVKCRTCNPASSTQWIVEYEKLQNTLPYVTKYPLKIDTNWTQSNEFWDDLLENSKNVKLIYINGGEPTLVEKHWNYLERLIERGLHKQVKLWYSINMTNLPDKLVNIWKQFKEVEVHCSIDDIGDRNSYLRKGTKWIDVESNIKKIQENDWIKFSITQTISWMNIYYVPEFNQYFDNLGIKVQSNIVYDPKFYNVSILSENVKQELEHKLVNFEHITKQVATNSDISLLKQGIEYNKWLDNSRSENYTEYFGEWAKIIGYD